MVVLQRVGVVGVVEESSESRVAEWLASLGGLGE